MKIFVELPVNLLSIKGTVHQYRNHVIVRYFTVCEIIAKHNFTRIHEIDNKQWFKDYVK